MILLDGKKLSEKILNNLKKKIRGRRLQLAVVLVGDDAVSRIFINQKKKACEKTGIDFKLFQFHENGSREIIKEKIKEIAENPAVSGVVIQLPLPASPAGRPAKFNTDEFLNLVPEEKDIDVLAEKSLGKFYQGRSKILPPTVSGILYLLKNYKITLKDKNVAIIGAGRLVGFPLALQLLKEKATVSVLNEWTKDTPFFTKRADVLISGVGWPNLIKGENVKKGAIVIDAGSSLKAGKVVGDVDFKSVSKKASYITPVPGGVGPLTVACLLDNLTKIKS